MRKTYCDEKKANPSLAVGPAGLGGVSSSLVSTPTTTSSDVSYIPQFFGSGTKDNNHAKLARHSAKENKADKRKTSEGCPPKGKSKWCYRAHRPE